jgi:hypothetical protein
MIGWAVGVGAFVFNSDIKEAAGGLELVPAGASVLCLVAWISSIFLSIISALINDTFANTNEATFSSGPGAAVPYMRHDQA